MRSYKFDFQKFLFSEEYKNHLRSKIYSCYQSLGDTKISLRVDNARTCYTSPVAEGFYVVLSPHSFNYHALVHAARLEEKESFKKEFLTLLSSMAFGALHEASHIRHTVFSIFEVDGKSLKTGLLEKRFVKRFKELSKLLPVENFETSYMSISNVIDDEAINRCLINRYQGSIKTGFMAFKEDQRKIGLKPLEELSKKANPFMAFVQILSLRLLFDFDEESIKAFCTDLDPYILEAFEKALRIFDQKEAKKKNLNESRFRVNLAFELCLIFWEAAKDKLEEMMASKIDSEESMSEDRTSYRDFLEELKEFFGDLDENCGACASFPEISQEIVSDTMAKAEAEVYLDEDFKEFVESTFSLDLSGFVETDSFTNEHFTPHKKAIREAKKLSRELKRRLLKSRRGRLPYQKSGHLDPKRIIRTQYATDVFSKRIKEDRLKDFKISVLLDTSGSMYDQEEELNKASVMLDVLSRSLDFPIRQYSYSHEHSMVRDYLSNDKSFSYLEKLSVDGGTDLPGALSFYEATRASKKELVIILSDSDVNEEETLNTVRRLKESEFHFLYLGPDLKDFKMLGYAKKFQHHSNSDDLGKKFLEIISRSIFA